MARLSELGQRLHGFYELLSSRHVLVFDDVELLEYLRHKHDGMVIPIQLLLQPVDHVLVLFLQITSLFVLK